MIEFLNVPDGLALSSPPALVATWFGAGLVEPLRAGLAVASIGMLALFVPGRRRSSILALVVLVAAFVAIETWEAATGTRDDRRIVVDEVAGALLLLALLGRPSARLLLVALPLFLMIDRWKPFPFDRLETLPGGFGVLADDLGVGLLVGASMLLAFRLAKRPALRRPG